MTNKISEQREDIWIVITTVFFAIIKIAYSIFIFVFTATGNKSSDDSNNTEKDGWRDGHSGYGFYSGDVRNDDDE